MRDVTVRWATVDDVEELTRLRRVMFDSMAVEVDAVVDGEEPRRLVACRAGMTGQRIPGPCSRP